MKLIAQVKLQPNKEQYRQLQATLEQVNEACNWISAWAWEHKVFGKYAIQKAIYQEIRARFGLSAQMTVRAIAKVSDSYKLDKKTRRTFKPYGSIAYDSRILSYKVNRREVSILTLEGRLKIPFVAGDKQLELLKNQQGESDLVFRKGVFYLFATCHIDDPEQIDPEGALGIDFGIVNIATDSDGEQYSGSQVLSIRKRRRRQRQRLQAKQTKSAKRVLKNLSGKEQRFATNENHRIAKQIVEKAQDTGRMIALEDLKGIRDRARLRKPQRINLHSWAFAQLGTFIQYKAALTGVPVVFVDPKYTSQACSECGCIDKRNRPNQSTFSCVSCGFALNADTNAALNISIRGWGAVNRPHVSTTIAIGNPKMGMAVTGQEQAH